MGEGVKQIAPPPQHPPRCGSALELWIAHAALMSFASPGRRWFSIGEARTASQGGWEGFLVGLGVHDDASNNSPPVGVALRISTVVGLVGMA